MIALFLGSIFGVTAALANPIYLPPHNACSTAAATSSVLSLATTTPTITLTCDAFALAAGLYDPTAMQSAVLALQVKSLSTATILSITPQYSDDGVDWYDDNMGAVGTTTGLTSVSQVKSFTWTMGTTSTSSKLITMVTPIRYIRVILQNSAGAPTSTVWATFIPRKESNR